MTVQPHDTTRVATYDVHLRLIGEPVPIPTFNNMHLLISGAHVIIYTVIHVVTYDMTQVTLHLT